MKPPLIVLLGAGASWASGNYAGKAMAPPLTVDLFNEDRYGGLLQNYALAHQAGRYINRCRAEDDALALEKALQDLRSSSYAHHRHMSLVVPLYLQDLLAAVSQQHETEAFRFDALIEAVLRLNYVFFVTLNYDLLLDRRLAPHHPLVDFRDYISTDKNWSLLKLHGSVNWYHETYGDFDRREPPPDLTVLPPLKCEPLRGEIQQARSAASYPALALPEGPSDELVMPSEHERFLRHRFQVVSEANLLVIGYSGLDSEVLDLLSASPLRIRKMTVVDRNQEAAEAVIRRFAEAGLEPIWPGEAVRGDFGSWSDAGGASDLVAAYDQAPAHP